MKIENGKIIPDPPCQFEYGDRWVQCDWCLCLRPADMLSVVNFDTGTSAAQCRDTDWCRKQFGLGPVNK